MTQTQAPTRYPFDLEAPLCELLDDEQLLFDAYAAAGGRQAVKAFCKKARWPGKPKLAFSIGEAQLKELLKSLFNTPFARQRLENCAAEARRKGKEDGVPALYQALWALFLERGGHLVDKVKEACHERQEGLLFMSPDDLGKLAAELAQAEGGDDEALRMLAVTVLAFVLLQPKDGVALADAFLGHFPQFSGSMGF